MKYISIGASIIKQHLSFVQEKRSAFSKRTTTLLTRFEQCWQPHEGALEVSEGEYASLGGEPSLSLSFTQLFLSVLPQFPRLSCHNTLKDSLNSRENIPARLEPTYLVQLLERANVLGFKIDQSAKEQLMAMAASSTPTIQVSEDIADITLPDWRGGKPFASTWQVLRKFSFLPSLARNKIRMDVPSPQFIQNDLVTAFFGDFDSCVKDKEDKVMEDAVMENLTSSDPRLENTTMPDTRPDSTIKRRKTRGFHRQLPEKFKRLSAKDKRRAARRTRNVRTDCSKQSPT